MRALGNLVLTLSLTIGALSAASAYLAPLSRPAERLVGLTLNADAGFRLDPSTGKPVRSDSGQPEPLVRKGTTLDLPLATALKAQAEDPSIAVDGRRPRRILVQQFDFMRWPGKWFFLLAVVGLIGGAMLVRKGNRARLAAAVEARKDGGSPAELLDSARSVVSNLLQALPGMPDDEMRCEAIVQKIGQLQRNELELFAEKREELVGSMGLAGFAALMDRFAAAERQVNRAWSLAADDVCDEAAVCLERSIELFSEALERVGSG